MASGKILILTVPPGGNLVALSKLQMKKLRPKEDTCQKSEQENGQNLIPGVNSRFLYWPLWKLRVEIQTKSYC
jgi:hypothetical protein